MGLYQVTIAITIGIYMILTMGLNIIAGYTGQVSLGHAAFFGVVAHADFRRHQRRMKTGRCRITH